MNFNTTAILKQISRFGKFALEHKRELLKTAEIATGIGAVVYAVAKTPEAVHAVEDAGMKKGEALTTGEKAKTVMGVMWPVALVGGAHVGFRVAYDIVTNKQIKAVTTANKGLMEQLVEMSTMYSTANDIKGAIIKKLGDKYTPEEVEAIKNEVLVEKAEHMSKNVRTDSTGTTPYLVPVSKLNEWNDIYLRTGNPDYKVCTFLDMFTGQKFMSCKYHVMDCVDTFKAKMRDEEDDRGYVTLNDWLSLVGAHTNTIGDNYIFRCYEDWFDITVLEYNDDGDLCWAIYLNNEPYYDFAKEY